MRTKEQKRIIIEENKFDYLGLLNQFIHKPESEENKKYDKCRNAEHDNDRIVVYPKDHTTKVYCPICLISFDVDCS